MKESALPAVSDPTVTAKEISEWIQFGIEAYVPSKTYQVRSVSQPCFTPECSAAIAHRNHYFHRYQRSMTTANLFRQARNSSRNGCSRQPRQITLLALVLLFLPSTLVLRTFGRSVTAFSASPSPLQLLLLMPMAAFLYHHTPKPNVVVINLLQTLRTGRNKRNKKLLQTRTIRNAGVQLPTFPSRTQHSPACHFFFYRQFTPSKPIGH